MAVDIRRSSNRYCREWLEDLLLYLEGQGVIEAVRERRPPHYHVAVFPKKYEAYVESLPEDAARLASGSGDSRYRVRNGDSLWTIARNHGLTVQEIRRANDLRGSRIYPGQLLNLGGENPQQLGR
jgi:nucleoid-associated protein YgaU